jgi:hypothetical protein
MQGMNRNRPHIHGHSEPNEPTTNAFLQIGSNWLHKSPEAATVYVRKTQGQLEHSCDPYKALTLIEIFNRLSVLARSGHILFAFSPPGMETSHGEEVITWVSETTVRKSIEACLQNKSVRSVGSVCTDDFAGALHSYRR